MAAGGGLRRLLWMLTELVVTDLGVIEHADLSLGPGSTALTGETGAGKTLLVTALGLLSGARAGRSLVRQGAAEARVEGRFSVPPNHPVLAAARACGALEAGGDGDEEIELVLARTLGADGRSRARLNGRLVTLAVLAEVAGGLIEIAGQHEHQRLGAPAAQRAVLDAYAGATDLAAQVAAAVRAAAAAERRAAELAAGERERARELDLVRYEIAEIEAAGMRQGELAELQQEAARLERAEALAEGVRAALAALSAEPGALDALAAAANVLKRAAQADDGLAALAARLEQARLEAEDVGLELARFEAAPDPGALERVRARLDQLARLRRKYGEREEDVLAHLDSARRRAAELEGSDSELEDTRAQAAELRARAEHSARRLSALRAAAAARLGPEVEELLGRLALPEARFTVALEPCALYEGGLETVELRVSLNPGEAPRPLAVVASGGELARIALALHLLTTPGEVTTLVFDEVDAGVGGEAARAVGEALAGLARRWDCQVLVVTHLPQVAAFADRHLRVTKVRRAGRAGAVVSPVEGPERVAELSRMLAGLPESERAREHAQELLELASKGSS